jgi:hypothetical protein
MNKTTILVFALMVTLYFATFPSPKVPVVEDLKTKEDQP